MMADVTDVALLRYKAKQEGIMFSSMETFQSIIQALVGFLVFWRLDNIGMVVLACSSWMFSSTISFFRICQCGSPTSKRSTRAAPLLLLHPRRRLCHRVDPLQHVPH